MKHKKIVSLLLVAAMAMSMTACGSKEEAPAADTTTTEKTETKEEAPAADDAATGDLVTLDFAYSGYGNYPADSVPFLQDLLAEKLGIAMNIWVTTDGATEDQTQLASGDFADIIEWGQGTENWTNVINGGYLVDLAQYKDKLPNVFENPLYEGAIEWKIDNHGDGEHLYSLPIRTGTQTNIYAFNPSVRWDLYEKVGKPATATWDEFLDMLEEMQALEPTTDEGLPTYALTMSGDSTHNFWLAYVWLRGAWLDVAGQIMCVNADGSVIEPAIADGSPLHEALQWVFEANQRGLLDPDGATQSAEDMQAKITNGQIMYTPFQWWGASNYNTKERMDAEDPKGYMELWADCMVLAEFSDNPVGNVRNVAITTSCENLDAALSYLNWLYGDDADEGAKLYASGPEGLYWEYDANGNQVPTQTYFDDNGDIYATEFEGGGTMNELRYVLGGDPIIAEATIDPATGVEWSIVKQDAFKIEKTYTKLEQMWVDHLGGVDDPWDIYGKTEKTLKQVDGWSNVVLDPDMQDIQNDINLLLGEAQVKMVYAKDQATFDEIWNQLKEDAETLGYAEYQEAYKVAWDKAINDIKPYSYNK